MGTLSDKIALVTGASGGIGAAIAAILADAGANVIGVDLSETEDSTGITSMACDLSDRRSTNDLPKRTGPVDILVNCAGVVPAGTCVETSDADWDRCFEINVSAAFVLCRGYLPAMTTRRSGVIVNIASVASSLKALPARAAYGASKAALIGLTKSIALDYVSQGVRCNAICPGTIATPLLEARIRDAADPDAERRRYSAQQPGGTLGTPEDIAAAALFLASPEASFVNGTFLPVDGGLLL